MFESLIGSLRPLVLTAAWCIALIALSGSAQGQTAEHRPVGEVQKPAWKWTLDERLAKRYDLDEIKARAEAKSIEDAKVREMFKDLPGASDMGRNSRADSIDGKAHPELFLPGELFDALLGDAFPSDELSPLETRRHLDAPVAALGFGRDFWMRLRRVAAPYLDLQREDEQLALGEARQPPSAKRSDSHGTALCQARAEALAAAKTEFGDERFLRLLYEAVAPNLAISYVPDESPADHLRFVEGGCR
jgi:hypothetical protein